jgi:hypothetical protein
MKVIATNAGHGQTDVYSKKKGQFHMSICCTLEAKRDQGFGRGSCAVERFIILRVVLKAPQFT